MHTQYNELKYLTLARFIFTAKAITTLKLPQYKGSTFRGGFGQNLKRTVCINKDDECSQCILHQNCIYTYIFETKQPGGSKSHNNFADIPHPFILIPPHTSKEFFNSGDTFSFELTLFGNAIDYLPYFIFVFYQLGKNGIGSNRGKFSIQSVKNELLGNEIEVYDSQAKAISGAIQVYSSDNFNHLYNNIIKANPDEIRIKLITPLRIKTDGKLRNDFTFFDFLKTLLNRLYFLSYFHCGNKSERQHRELLEMSKDINISDKVLVWHDWIRYSARQQTKMKMGGLLGEFTLKGELATFLPFLKVGEFIHLGKATTMGLGRYQIIKGDW
jgi:CRISPR-associated endoribonuclease Cas6